MVTAWQLPAVKEVGEPPVGGRGSRKKAEVPRKRMDRVTEEHCEEEGEGLRLGFFLTGRRGGQTRALHTPSLSRQEWQVLWSSLKQPWLAAHLRKWLSRKPDQICLKTGFQNPSTKGCLLLLMQSILLFLSSHQNLLWKEIFKEHALTVYTRLSWDYVLSLIISEIF